MEFEGADSVSTSTHDSALGEAELVRRQIHLIIQCLLADKRDAARVRRDRLRERLLPEHGSPLEKQQYFAKQDVMRHVGCRIPNRLAAFQAGTDILSHLHELGLESAVALLLDQDNWCVHAEIRFGDEYSVEFPQEELVDACIRTEAAKIILMHNHPDETSTPSDADILHAATLFVQLPEGISLVDDLVWCRTRVSSILGSKQFKELIKEY